MPILRIACARIALATAVSALLLAAGCSSSSGGAKSCGSDSDCDLGQSCLNARCTAFDAGPAQPLGGPCFESAQCATGTVCELDGTGLSGGLCSQACSGGSCPTDTICADLRSTPVNAEICVPTAAASDAGTCREGWSACAAFSGACLPAALCPASGVSSAASPDLGAACTPGSCAAGETCRFGADFPGGACTLSCSPTDATTCPSNGACAITDQGPLCLSTCTGPSACRSGYSCAAVAGSPLVCSTQTLAPRTCTPGALPLIVAGGTAGQPTAPTFCLEPIASSSLPAGMVQELGPHNVGDVVEFQVPAQAASISIVSQSLHARANIDTQGTVLDNTVVPTDVIDPSGQTIYDDNATPPTDLSTATVEYETDSPVTGVLTFPNTTAGLAFADGGLPGGTWKFTVNDYAAECTMYEDCDGGSTDGVYDVSVLVKPGPAQVSGTIDVAFYLVGAPGLTSATAAGNAHVQRMLQTLETLYQQAGLCLGTVTFYDVPTWAQNLYATGVNADKTGPCDDLNQMFTLAHAGNTLNFFLVEDISSTNAGGTVVGIDGTIPGPSTLGGTIHSGAAVSAADLTMGSCSGSGIDFANCGADVVAYITAHEGGHWMGLYHTTEADGEFWDPLSDTATCTCTLCTTGSRQSACGASSNATFIEATDCDGSTPACGGADDLMFWLLDPTVSKGTLSGQQSEVMRHNLLVQ